MKKKILKILLKNFHISWNTDYDANKLATAFAYTHFEPIFRMLLYA